MLLATTVSSFLGPFLGSAVNLAIPLIGREMGAPAVVLSWIVTTYLLTSAAFLLPFGRLGDLAGRTRVFVAGSLLQAAASLGCAAAADVATLIACRLLQGVGGAMNFATGFAIVVSSFPTRSRGRVLGVVTAAVYLGLSLGPVAGGLLTHYAGWRSIFALNAAAGLAVAVVAAVGIRSQWHAPAGERFDTVGAVLYTASLAALLGGVSTLGRHAWAPWAAWLGAAGLALFVAVELRVARPLLELRLFRSLVFAFSNVAALVHYSATFAVTFLLSLYLQAVHGLDPQRAGLVLLAQPVMMAALSPLAGRLSDRVEPRVVASVGMLLSLAGLVPLTFLDRATPLAVVVASLLVLGVGFGLFSSPNSNAVMSAVSRSQLGVGAATLSTMRVVGQAASMALVALILGRAMGQRALEADSTEPLLVGLRWSFLLFAALCAAGVPLSLARGKMAHGAGEEA